MTEAQFLDRMQSAFQKQLPGPNAHQLLTPGKRPLTRDEVQDISAYRDSAVALICFPKNNEINAILTQRPVYEGTHGGQISFPGGKQEITDKTLEETARRETFEEIGWTVKSEDCLGSLTELFIPVSKFSVQPFLYFTNTIQEYHLDAREVEEVIEFPLSILAKATTVQSTDITYSTGMRLKNVPYFAIEDRIVWGATAIVLSELRSMLYPELFLF